MELDGGMVFNKALDKYSSSLPSRHMIQLYFPSPANEAQPSNLMWLRPVTRARAQFAMSLLPPQHPATLLMVKALHS